MTLIIAVVGAVTGVFGIWLQARDSADQRAIHVKMLVQVTQRDYTNEGFAIRVALLNTGRRAVNLTSAQLMLDARNYGWVSGFLPSQTTLDRYAIEPAAVTDTREDLPLTVQPGDEQRVALLVPARRNPNAPQY
jgi:hypothetical protein